MLGFARVSVLTSSSCVMEARVASDGDMPARAPQQRAARSPTCRAFSCDSAPALASAAVLPSSARNLSGFAFGFKQKCTCAAFWCNDAVQVSQSSMAVL